jgi:DNA-binding CsgD family transcriptional regulator/PAS domain-containing protein
VDQDPTCAKIVHLAHHAAGDPSLWGEIAARLRRPLRAPLVALIEHNLITHHGRISHGAGLDEGFRALYGTRFASQNVWLRAPGCLEPCRVLTGAELVPNWELVGTDFYRQWLRPQGAFHCLLGIASRCGEEIWCLIALRPLEAAPFEGTDKRRLATLLTRLQCACELCATFAATRHEMEALGQLISALPEAILIVDAETRPLTVNRAAECLLERNDGLRRVNGMLVAESTPETHELRRLIAQAAGVSAVTNGAAGGNVKDGEIAISLSSGAPLLLQIVPLRHTMVGRFGKRKHLAAVIARPIETARRLCAFYRMTPAESRLAALIFDGHSLVEAAADLHITKNTARTHMKRIYAKTDTHRQADLIRLLANHCGVHSR